MIGLYQDLSVYKTGANGLPQGLIRLWYLVVGEKRMSYAAPRWACNLNAHAVRKLRSAQRVALLFIVGAYRRTSTEALNVLAGIPPIELTLRRDCRYHRVVRLGKEVLIGDLFFNPSEIEQEGLSSRIDPQIQLPYTVCKDRRSEVRTLTVRRWLTLQLWHSVLVGVVNTFLSIRGFCGLLTRCFRRSSWR